MEKFFQSDYVYLSQLIFTRLLKFNARRGREPGKLTLTDWTMVEKDRCKRKEDLERLVDPIIIIIIRNFMQDKFFSILHFVTNIRPVKKKRQVISMNFKIKHTVHPRPTKV